MYYKFLKLTNGENLIVSTDDNCDTFCEKEFISVLDPILVGIIRVPKDDLVMESYVFQPWIKMGVEDVVKIPTSSIVVAVDLNESAKEHYLNYLHDMSLMDDSLQEATEEESQVTIEEFLENMKTSDEEEEDGNRNQNRRTLH